MHSRCRSASPCSPKLAGVWKKACRAAPRGHGGPPAPGSPILDQEAHRRLLGPQQARQGPADAVKRRFEVEVGDEIGGDALQLGDLLQLALDAPEEARVLDRDRRLSRHRRRQPPLFVAETLAVRAQQREAAERLLAAHERDDQHRARALRPWVIVDCPPRGWCRGRKTMRPASTAAPIGPWPIGSGERGLLARRPALHPHRQQQLTASRRTAGSRRWGRRRPPSGRQQRLLQHRFELERRVQVLAHVDQQVKFADLRLQLQPLPKLEVTSRAIVWSSGEPSSVASCRGRVAGREVPGGPIGAAVAQFTPVESPGEWSSTAAISLVQSRMLPRPR